jgi:hypothetical protein
VVGLDNSNPDQAKKISPNQLDRNSEAKDRRKYQIYCNKRHLLYLTNEDFYRTIVRGHVITTLRIHEFTTFGFEKKTDIGEKHGAN